jgi:hypothetical protein
MAHEQQVGAVQLNARLRGVSPPVTRRIHIAEQLSLGELHAALQGERSIPGATRPGETDRKQIGVVGASARNHRVAAH